MVRLWYWLLRATAWKDRVLATPARAYSTPASRRLARAVVRDDVARVRRLLAKGADVNAIGAEGVNLLFLAWHNECLGTFTALLEAGIDTDLRDCSGKSVLHRVASWPDPRYLETILRYPVDVDIRDSVYGHTPLLRTDGYGTNMRMLLAAGADPDITDEFGRTILFDQAILQEYRWVLDLLEAGANPVLEDRKGRTFQSCLSLEQSQHGDPARFYEQIIDWLRDHDVPVTMPPRYPDDQRIGCVLAVIELRDGERWKPAYRLDPRDFDESWLFEAAYLEARDELDRRGLPARLTQREYAFADPVFQLPIWNGSRPDSDLCGRGRRSS